MLLRTTRPATAVVASAVLSLACSGCGGGATAGPTASTGSYPATPTGPGAGLVPDDAGAHLDDPELTAQACEKLVGNVITNIVLTDAGLLSSTDPASVAWAVYADHPGVAGRIEHVGDAWGHAAVTFQHGGSTRPDPIPAINSFQEQTTRFCDELSRAVAANPALGDYNPYGSRVTDTPSSQTPETTPDLVTSQPVQDEVPQRTDTDTEENQKLPCVRSFVPALLAVADGKSTADQAAQHSPDQLSRTLLRQAAATQVPEMIEFGYPPKDAAAIASHALIDYCLSHPTARAR